MSGCNNNVALTLKLIIFPTVLQGTKVLRVLGVSLLWTGKDERKDKPS